MKRLVPFLLLLSHFCFGQNYYPLQTGAKHYFINGDNYLRTIRIDSIHSYQDSIIYFSFHTPRGYYNPNAVSTLDPTGSSWMGKSPKQLTDGTMLTSNFNGDSIVIKSQAGIGDTWVFFKDTGTFYYRAMMVQNDTATVMNTLDSVKTIIINAYNNTGLISSDPLDSFEIQLSKNHGLVEVFDLYTFPYHTPGSSYAPGLDYYLDQTVSVTPDKNNSIYHLVSYEIPKLNQLYEWNVGDVYQFRTCDGIMMLYGVACTPVHEYDLDTVIGIVNNGNSMGYVVDERRNTLTSWSESNFWYYNLGYNDTMVTYTYSPTTSFIFDTLHASEETGQGTMFYYYPTDTSFCINNPLYRSINNNFLHYATYSPPFEQTQVMYSYKAPFGIISKTIVTSTTFFAVSDTTLTFVNRGGVTCGNLQYPPSKVYQPSLGNFFEITPNPVMDYLNIEVGATSSNTITITNMLGQQLWSKTTSAQKLSVSVGNYPSGLYLVKIVTPEGYTETRKIYKK